MKIFNPFKFILKTIHDLYFIVFYFAFSSSSVLFWLLLSTMVVGGVIGSQLTYNFGVKPLIRNAIANGSAKYDVDVNGNAKFEWIKNNNNERKD